MTTKRIPLTQPIESRAGNFTKDSRSVNCVFEKRDQKREFVKRPGLVFATQVTPVTPPAYLQSQGLVSYGTNLISVINNTVYKTNPSGYVTTTLGSTSASTTQSYFAKSFLDTYLFFHNTHNAYTYNGTTFGTVSNTSISAIDITTSGSGYSQGLTPAFSAGGCAATLVIDPASGAITGVTITNAGSGLGVAPGITLVKPADAITAATNKFGFYPQTMVVTSAAGIYIGMAVSGSNITVGTIVTGISGTEVYTNFAVGTLLGNYTFTDAGINGQLTAVLNAFPAGPFVPGIVSLSNYMFIATTDGSIYNSKLNAPTTWTGSTIVFNQTTDTLVAIVRHLNYLVALGKSSMQFFYDSGNGTDAVSPLLPAQSYTTEIGCANADSIVATSNTAIWIGATKTHGRAVYLLDGVSPIKISTSNIDKHLDADGLSQVTAYCYKFGGHTLYILTLHTSNETLVFDLEEKMWYQWTQYAMISNDQGSIGTPGTWAESYFRPTFYAEVNNVPFVLDDDTATIYTFSVGTYQDVGQDIYCRTVTDIIDNGTTKRKFYGRLEIIGDKVAGGVMQVRHSGDDYVTWSSYRSVDLNASRAQVYLSGSDRRRAWEFLCTSNVPLRLDGAEIDFRVGELDQEQDVGGGRYRG